MLFAFAVISEKMCKKRLGDKYSKISRTHKMALIGLFSALAAILMYIEFPLPFAPSFYTIDFSEIPVLISGFMMGPVAAVATEFIKILIKLIIKPTSTAFVGEFANFVVGASFIIPASICYHLRKTRKNALIGMSLGTIVMTVVGCFTNAFILLPVFAQLYGGMSVSELIAMGTAVNGNITGMFTFIVLAVAPLNLIKGILTSLVVFIIYKRISSVIKLKMN